MYCLNQLSAKAREAITKSQRLILAPVGLKIGLKKLVEENSINFLLILI